MIYLAIIYGVLFFVLGYLIKFLQTSTHIKQEEDFYLKFKNFGFLSLNDFKNSKKKPNLYLVENKSILINSNTNSALQEIFDIIIANYINSWYLGFSNNEDFIVEIKYFFHTLCAEILLRFSKISIPELVSQKFLPAFINHLDICYTIQSTNNENINSLTPVQEVLLQKMRNHLHVAMISRAEEVAYLKSTSKFLIPIITPEYFSRTKNKISDHFLQECFSGTVLLPAMDSIASPDLINKFIYLLLTPSTISTTLSNTQSSLVPILHRYQTAWMEKLKRQEEHPKGIECLRNEKHLYHFLQYIKSVEAVSAVNIFMQMDAIILKLLSPDMDESTKVLIFQDLERFENLIQLSDEKSNLNISPDLRRRIKEAIADGHQNVDRLRNCEIWMENYQLISQHTQSLYLTQYFESEFFLSTIYGDRLSDIDTSYECEWEDINVTGDSVNVVNPEHLDNENVSRQESSPEIFSFKKMSLDLFSFDFMSDRKSPIMEDQKSAFSTPDRVTAPAFPFFQSIFLKEKELSQIDKQKEFSMSKFGLTIKQAFSNNSDDSLNSISGDLDMDNVDGSEWLSNSFGDLVDLPDLSNLRVKIPSISQPYISNKKKGELYFSVYTYKVDSEKLLYKVHRKYGEFYILEQKLLEFHGTIERTLPTKRPWDNKNLDFLEKCKPEFETYLMYLVNRSFLRNSELLHRFLTRPTEFSFNTLMDINLGRFVKSMPMKLAKEKGQFLDQFLNNFHISCEATSQVKSNSTNDSYLSTSNSVSDLGSKSLFDTRLHTRMYWNNAELNTIKSDNFMKDICSFSTRYIFYYFDSLCFFFEIITNKLTYSHYLLNFFYRIRSFFVGILQTYVTETTSKGIEKLCHEKVAVEILHVLRDAALLAGLNRTSSEKQERRNQALTCLYQLFPDWLSVVLSDDQTKTIYSNIDRIFDFLQQPKLNKQLSYVLFDILLLELFPELTDNVVAHNQNEESTKN